MTSTSAPRVRAWAFLKSALILEKASSMSEKSGTFFERQLEPPEDVALRGGRDPRPFGLLDELAVL